MTAWSEDGHRLVLPAPEWAPRTLAPVGQKAAPGDRRRVLLRLENASGWPTPVEVTIEGDIDGVTVEGSPSVLEPLGTVEVTLTRVVATAADPGSRSVLVRVHGFHEHLLRWRTEVRSSWAWPLSWGRSEPVVVVHDRPHLVHQWYDHFAGGPPAA